MASVLDLKVQGYLAVYSGIISTLSPSLTTIQLLKTFNKSVSAKELASISLRIFPHQCFLKWAQMNAATPVKEHANPWVAFGVVGVLQGGVYGQCTTYVSKLLGLAKKPPKLQDLLRGSAFAGTRDTISQGVPFAYSATVQRNVVDPVYASLMGPVHDTDASQPVRRMVAVMVCSIGATVASQFPHNCQIRMQADPALGYAGVVQKLTSEFGPRALYMGASARIALLLVVNGLNELVLKKAWAKEED